MAKWILLATAALLTGCDQARPAAPAGHAENGRYMIVPVAPEVRVPGPEGGPGAMPEVWRLDTQTGALDICYQQEGVKCSQAKLPNMPSAGWGPVTVKP